MKQKKKEGLLRGVLVLSASGILVKLLGFFYRVPLNAVLGDEMANVNAALSVWAVLYTVTAAGIPTAMAVLTAEASARKEDPSWLLFPALRLLCAVGGAGALLLLLTAHPLSRLTSEGEGTLSLLAVAPALLFVAPAGVLRGFHQGEGRMAPLARAELLEAVGKMGFGILLAFLALRLGLSPRSAAALSVLGVAAGAGMGLLSLALPLCGRKSPSLGRGCARRILAISLPIAATSLLLNLSALVDAFALRPVLSRLLEDGALGKRIYSDYSTGALPLFHLPAVVISPIVVSLVPRVSRHLAAKREEDAARALGAALRLASLVGMGAAAVLGVLGEPLLGFLFSSDPTMEAVAGPLLRLLSPAVYPLALFTVASGTLSCLRLQGRAIPALLVGLLLKVAVSLLLAPLLGAAAFPLGTLAFYTVGAAAGLLLLRRLGAFASLGALFFRPLGAAAVAAGVMLGSYRGFSALLGRIALFPALALGGLAFLLSALLFGCVGKEEWAMLSLPSRLSPSRSPK
jgi:stage V sporulation protein B